MGPNLSPTAECLSRQYQGYLERRDLILIKTTNVFGSPDLVAEWFIKTVRGLDYRPPCSVIMDNHDYKLVYEYLDRIEYGVY
ncbi:MbcA/ParS/Xre antitoxin family protein [Pseudomonas viridiflava]|uniref:antitoxin Xre/MbcA/ParS toxin-binding domain-containing protein n=1 Tax=Pseudomonas viridiflava TaxID=33069 RepID=UPI0009B7DDA1